MVAVEGQARAAHLVGTTIHRAILAVPGQRPPHLRPRRGPGQVPGSVARGPHVLLPVAAALLAMALALYLAPILIRAALRYGIVDRPNTPLKDHKEPTPYLGGLVVFV